MNLNKLFDKKPTYQKLSRQVDFFALFQKIEKEFTNCFLFESLGSQSHVSRYAILGFDPRHIINAKGHELSIDGKKQTVTNPYKQLQKLVPQTAIARQYAGGLVGYLSYEAVNYFEESLQVKVHPDFPQFMFGVYTDGLIFDKVTGETYYFYYDKNRINVIEKLLTKQIPSPQKPTITFLGDTLTKQEHKKIVLSVQEEIRKGNTFQCEVGFKSKFSISGETIGIYEKLRQVNPSPFMYYVKFSNKKIIGASPELLLSLRNGELNTILLAGTARRGKNEKEDQLLAKELLHDKKEIAEHNMLVDLHRNDIGKVSEFGTVKIRNLMDILKFSHVQHIASEIAGIIKTGEDMFSAVASNFPMGTVTGAPKVETMKIIDRNEPEARGPYGGGVGHFGFNGDATFALALRSLFIRGEDAYAQTSSGIVYDSNPEKEYEEIVHKLAAMKEVLGV